MNKIYISIFVTIFILFINFSKAISAELNYNSGAKYVGEVLNGLPHGVGTLYNTTGGKIIGEFKYGELNGVATTYIPKERWSIDGVEATCGWTNNKVDQCVYTLQNGKKMLVTFKNNKPISQKPLQRHETYQTLFQRSVKNIQDNSTKYAQKGKINKWKRGSSPPFPCGLMNFTTQAEYDKCANKYYQKQDENWQKALNNKDFTRHCVDNTPSHGCVRCNRLADLGKMNQFEYQECTFDAYDDARKNFVQLEKERAIIKKNREMKKREIKEKKIRLCNSSKNVTSISTVFWENLSTQLQVNMLNPNYKIIDVKWVEFGTFLFIPLGGSCMVKIYTEKGACNAPVDVVSSNGKKHFHSYNAKPCMHSF